MKNKIFNTVIEDIEKRNYNVFIGISLGVLKPLTESMAKEYLRWALDNSRRNVIILIADEIAKFNYNIFSNYSKGKAENRALREGDKYVMFFSKIVKTFPSPSQRRIHVLRWKDIWDKRKEQVKKVLDDEYSSNKDFSNVVHSFLENYSRRRNKKLNNQQLDYLAQYILFELATLIDGINYAGELYNLLLYPTFASSGMSQLAMDIQNGVTFPKIKQRLKLNKKIVMVESYMPIEGDKV